MLDPPPLNFSPIAHDGLPLGVVVVVVVGLQESHLQWYGLELGSDPPSPLCPTMYQRLVVGGVKTGTGFPARKTRGFRQLDGRGGGRRSA